MRLQFGTWIFVGFYLGIHGQKKCTKINSCKCQSDDGIIDLSPLDSGDPSKPNFRDVTGSVDKAQYSFNPCSNFNEGTNCVGVAACQSASGDTYSLGNQDSAVFANVNNDLVLQFSGKGLQDQILRTSHITLKCDQKTDVTFAASGEHPNDPTNYYMTLTSKHACPKKGPEPTPTPSGGGGGLSVGTVICIIILVLVLVYIAAGIVFNRVRRGATGVEMVPQVAFWKDFPFLVKDGVVYVYTGFKGKVLGYGEMK